MKSMCVPAGPSSPSSSTSVSPLSSMCVTPAARGLTVRSGSSRKPGVASPDRLVAKRAISPPVSAWSELIASAGLADPRMPRSSNDALSQVHQLSPSGAQARELDEVLRVEEQLVHLPELIDRKTLGTAQERVEVLERVLGSVADMVEAEDTPRSGVDDALLQAGELRLGEGVEHRPLGAGQRVVALLPLGRHADDRDVVVALARLLLGQADPADLVGRVEEVGILAEVERVVLAHDVACRRHAALARLEHLHR